MIPAIRKFGDAVLRRPAQPVEAVTADIEVLIDRMVAAMYAAPGIGLAAPQIGVPLRIFVIDLSVGREAGALLTVINPEWVSRDGMQLEEEGCLSVPGFTATVARPHHAVIRGMDRTGTVREHTGEGLLARAFQHEMDHLDGTLFIDRLRGIRRDLILRRIHKLQRDGRW